MPGDDEQQPEPTPTLRSLSTPSSSLSAGIPALEVTALRLGRPFRAAETH